ncbi:MAG: EAL domain-containing protein [Acidimicrobiales bacterium]
MTTRLIALVMLPVTVVCIRAGAVVADHRTAANQAVAVEHGVTGLSDLVALRDALSAQQSVEEFDVRFAQLGTTRAAASLFVGVDLSSQVVPARARADHAIASLGSGSPVQAGALASLYADIDGGGISPTEAVQRFGALIEVSATAVASGLQQLQAQAQHPPLVAALDSLRASSDVVEASMPQAIDLSAIWFPAPGETPQMVAAGLARFGASSASYTAAVARLRALGVTSVVGNLTRVEADTEVQAFDQAVAATLLGHPLTEAGAAPDLVKVADAFRGFLTRSALLDGLVATSTAAVRDEARLVAASERSGFVAWAVGGAALALISIGVALWLARSISKPIKDLARYAHDVNEGQLDVEPSLSRNHGPRETRVAFGLITDLVANLQLLDAKTNALAHCDFDDPVLREPLPGRLGRSLESSVALLSGSIVERDQLQTHLAYAATHDSLTGIGNRPAAIREIQAALNRAARTGDTTALLFVDLNDFKAVNDSHGHEVGDEVLRQVAARMTDVLRNSDFVARLGGDEFVVIAEAVVGVADAADLARRIIETVNQPFEIDGFRISIGAAVGIALSLDGPEEPFRLLARADAAMYRAKRHDRSAMEIFDVGMQQELIERDDIESALTAALEDPAGGGLILQYQPVLNAVTDELCGVEALVRWDRPGHGRLAPISFIPIAEATSLIIDLDCWVLARATQQMVAWSAIAKLVGLRVSVNISGRHVLSGQLASHIRVVLENTGIDPGRLGIEITETVLLDDLVEAAAELDAVRALGVSVAIDDFGTGYTSLAHLQQLPIDNIKIDRSFINHLDDRRGRSLVRMITDLGHAIDLKIVAEGVETAEQLDLLKAMGADFLQGFLFSRPLDPEAMSAWAIDHVAAGHQPSTPVA